MAELSKEREECLREDKERLERELESCYTHPGCDYAETCVEVTKARAEDRVEGCVRRKKEDK